VSQKVSKRAVVRNLVKRRIRSALLHFLPRICPGWAIVVIARSSAPECDYRCFLQELEQLLIEAEVLDGH
jgi:ribonuclease P protein component